MFQDRLQNVKHLAFIHIFISTQISFILYIASHILEFSKLSTFQHSLAKLSRAFFYFILSSKCHHLMNTCPLFFCEVLSTLRFAMASPSFPFPYSARKMAKIARPVQDGNEKHDEHS